MARPVKYPVKFYVRLKAETLDALTAKSKVLELTPAETARLILEHSLSGKPIKFERNKADV